ncbi:MAG: hypothetical protein LBE82_02055, partial [Chitinophagaceae bacterium]|nr:hypothetical protein [Chitinophagaceae bacterium]
LSITTWEFFYILIEHHGERALAVSNAMRNIFGLFGFMSWSFGAVANTMVSNIIGQGMHDKVMKLIKMILTLCISMAAFICLVLNLFPEIFFKIYGQNEDFIREAIPVMRVVSTALLLTSLAVVWLNAVVGTGNSRINLYIEIAAIIVYSAFAYTTLEVLKMPITIGWMAEWAYWTTMFVPSYLYMMSGRWKNKKI